MADATLDMELGVAPTADTVATPAAAAPPTTAAPTGTDATAESGHD